MPAKLLTFPSEPNDRLRLIRATTLAAGIIEVAGFDPVIALLADRVVRRCRVLAGSASDPRLEGDSFRETLAALTSDLARLNGRLAELDQSGAIALHHSRDPLEESPNQTPA